MPSNVLRICEIVQFLYFNFRVSVFILNLKNQFVFSLIFYLFLHHEHTVKSDNYQVLKVEAILSKGAETLTKCTCSDNSTAIK